MELNKLKEKLLLQKGLGKAIEELDWNNISDEELDNYKELLLKQPEEYICDVLDYLINGDGLIKTNVSTGVIIYHQSNSLYNLMKENDYRNERIEDWLSDLAFEKYMYLIMKDISI